MYFRRCRTFVVEPYLNTSVPVAESVKSQDRPSGLPFLVRSAVPPNLNNFAMKSPTGNLVARASSIDDESCNDFSTGLRDGDAGNTSSLGLLVPNRVFPSSSQ